MVTKYGYWHLWMCKCKHRCATAPRDQVILKPCVYSSGRLTKLDELFVSLVKLVKRHGCCP